MGGASRGLLILLGVLVFLALLGPLFGGGWGMMGPGMMGSTGWSRGPGWGLWMLFGWLPMIAFWAAVVVGLILLARAVGICPRRSEDGDAPEPARRRDAAGEITREESERQRSDVSGVS